MKTLDLDKEQPGAGRIDLWLKLVCVFKHRADALEACKGGVVRINGQRAKPSSRVHPNDLVEIGGERYRRLVVLEIPKGTIAKDLARTMYRDETPPPPPDQVRQEGAASRERGMGRPTKRERREIDKFRR